MKPRLIVIRAMWDDETAVWTASTTDIDGFAAEAPTLEALSEKLPGMLIDLIEENGHHGDWSEIPVQIIAERMSRIPNPQAA